MRDPMSWAVTLFRPFGVPVKVHLFFVVVALGFFLREVAFDRDSVVWWVDVLLFTVPLLFGLVLLHEFGHCLAGAAVGGEPTEVLIWPLGGLASVDVPPSWRAHIVTAIGGPAVNAIVCLVCAALLVANGFAPTMNLLANPYVSEVKNSKDGRTYTSEYALRVYKAGTAERAEPPKEWEELLKNKEFFKLDQSVTQSNDLERAVLRPWQVWVNRTFWLSWLLLVLNVLPAYPLDGGQVLQGLVWARTDARQGTAVAAYAGYLVGVLFLIAALALREPVVMGLALFVVYCSWARLSALDAEEAGFGDFSQGYLSLEQDEPPPQRPKRVGWVRRMLQARAARRLQRELEEQQREDERMDQLLEKIAQAGKNSLTDEERRFMERVAARYRNRS